MALPEKWLPGGAYYESTLEKFKASNGMFSLDSIPSDAVDEEMALAWLNTTYGVLHNIPTHLRTSKVCKAAVEKSGYLALSSIPENVLDREMCLCVAKNCYTLDGIPSKFLDEELVLTYITQPKGFGTLRAVPVHLRTEKVCTEAYRCSPSEMAYIPRELQFAVYENAVQGGFESGWMQKFRHSHPPLSRQYAELLKSDAGVLEADAPLVRQVNES